MVHCCWKRGRGSAVITWSPHPQRDERLPRYGCRDLVWGEGFCPITVFCLLVFHRLISVSRQFVSFSISTCLVLWCLQILRLDESAGAGHPTGVDRADGSSAGTESRAMGRPSPQRNLHSSAGADNKFHPARFPSPGRWVATAGGVPDDGVPEQRGAYPSILGRDESKTATRKSRAPE